jgi:hypothetical protein
MYLRLVELPLTNETDDAGNLEALRSFVERPDRQEAA